MCIDVSGKILKRFWGHFMGKLFIAAVFLAAPVIAEIISYPIPDKFWALKAGLYIISLIIAMYGAQKEPPLFQKKLKNDDQQSEHNWKILCYIIFIVFYIGVIYSFCNKFTKPIVEESSQDDPVVPTITPLPIIDVNQIGECVEPYDEELCWFNVTNIENSPIKIAEIVYPNKIYAWRIAELMRDKDGIISKTPKRLLIPHLDSERTIDSLIFNLNIILGGNFKICDGKKHFPCLLKTDKNESYVSIAEDYYFEYNEIEVIKQLQSANDIEYYGNDLRPPEDFPKDTIVFLPKIP